jgi:hypothetical protein
MVVGGLTIHHNSSFVALVTYGKTVFASGLVMTVTMSCGSASAYGVTLAMST